MWLKQDGWFLQYLLSTAALHCMRHLHQFIKFLQPSEGSRTHTVCLQPLTGEVPHCHCQWQCHYAQLSSVFTFIKSLAMTPGCYRLVRLVGHNLIFCLFMRETSNYPVSHCLLSKKKKLFILEIHYESNAAVSHFKIWCNRLQTWNTVELWLKWSHTDATI